MFLGKVVLAHGISNCAIFCFTLMPPTHKHPICRCLHFSVNVVVKQTTLSVNCDKSAKITKIPQTLSLFDVAWGVAWSKSPWSCP